MVVLSYIVTVFAAYLLGSIPTGFLVGKAKGVDIRSVGSGNIGATNAMRVLGKPAGIFVLVMDALKGFGACYIGAVICVNLNNNPADLAGKAVGLIERASIIAGIFAILGHNYTCWLKFKGGKGIATTAGVMGALVPWALLIVVALFIVVFVATRYVSVGSICAAAALPFATWFTTHDISLTVISGVLGALAIFKHKKNIQRLMDGTENRIEFKKTETAK